MARKSSKKTRKPAPAAKRAAKAKPLVAASGSVRRERGVAKRAAKAKPLVAASASVRRGRGRARLDVTVPATPQLDAKLAVVAPRVPAFSLMDTMKRLSIANVEHAARLAACRTPMEFWFERMRFGQSLFAQWQSSVHSALPGSGMR